MSNFGAAITFIYTADMKKAQHLWEDILQLDCVIEQSSCRIYRVAGGAFIGVCRLQDRPTGTVGVTVTLVAEDVDDVCARVQKAGYAFERGPAYLSEFSIYSALFYDTDGYRIEVQRFCIPDQERALISRS